MARYGHTRRILCNFSLQSFKFLFSCVAKPWKFYDNFHIWICLSHSNRIWRCAKILSVFLNTSPFFWISFFSFSCLQNRSKLISSCKSFCRKNLLCRVCFYDPSVGRWFSLYCPLVWRMDISAYTKNYKKKR